MDDLSLSEWKKFLSARMSQENGNDKDALVVFEELSLKHPRNSHLLASKAIALSRLGDNEEAKAAVIASKYASLGKTLVGDADDPKAWNEALSAAISEIEQFEGGPALGASALVAW